MELTESHSGWHLAFDNATLQMLKLDFRLSLLLTDGGDTAEVVIETPFQFTDRGVCASCVPERPETLAPVLVLVNKKVVAIQISATGHMTLFFESDLSIHVEPNASYEAWQIGGSRGFLLVCQPEGTVSLFRDEGSKASATSITLN